MTHAQAHKTFEGLREAIASRYPVVRGVKLVICRKHFLTRPKARDLAWYDLDTRTIHLVERALEGPDGRVAGLLAHELGHAADPVPDAPYAERRADAMAKKATGIAVRYDKDDVQNLKRGVTPRPERLPENRPKGASVKHKRRNPRVFRSVAIESNRQPSFKSNWADFAKVADVGELDLDAIAYDTGYDNFRNLDMSVSPRTIAKERGTPSGSLRFRKFAKAIREHSLKLEDASADQIAKALMGEAIKRRNPRFDNQGRNLEAVKRTKESEQARYIAGSKDARAMFEKTVKDVPLADWTTVDGVEVLRSGSSRYVAAPRNGKRTAASFDVIDIKAGELVVQLKKDEVYGWLWRAAKNEHEMKRNPTAAYHRARGDAELFLAEDAYGKAQAMSRRGDAKGAHDSYIHAHRMAALAESDLLDGASPKAAQAKGLAWWKAYSHLAQSTKKRNPAKGYKMPEAQAKHTAEGLLKRMKADGADTFAKKVAWVKKHIPSVDRPRTFVGWVTKGERGRVVIKRNPEASYADRVKTAENARAQLYRSLKGKTKDDLLRILSGYTRLHGLTAKSSISDLKYAITSAAHPDPRPPRSR